MKFPAIVYYPLQWTWGILQNIVGLVIFAVNGRREHFRYGLSVATVWGRAESMSMGMFIFLAYNLTGDLEDENSIKSQVAVHEYGHTFQSLALGPFYLPVISAVSGIWCMIPIFEKMRREKGINYYQLYTERWANHLGLKITKKMPHGYRETHPNMDFSKWKEEKGSGAPEGRFRKNKESSEEKAEGSAE